MGRIRLPRASTVEDPLPDNPLPLREGYHAGEQRKGAIPVRVVDQQGRWHA